MRSTRFFLPRALVAAACLVPVLGFAQPIGFDGLTGGGASSGTGSTPAGAANPDRTAILLLSKHLKQLNEEIARASRFQQDMLAEAAAREEAARKRKEAAEAARRKANQRAARNALIGLVGAATDTDVSGDLAFLNAVDDVSDALSARDAQSQADFRRRAIYTPLLFGDDPGLRDLDNAYVALRENRNVRRYGAELEAARGRMRQAQVEAKDLDTYIRSLESDREKALAMLDGFVRDYLGRVNQLVAGIPGFVEAFGSVQDLAFALDLPLDSREPLVLALTFHVRSSDRAQHDVVDVKLSTLREFVEDGFATLVSQREAAVRAVEAEIAAARAGLTSVEERRARVQTRIDAEKARLAATSGIKVFTRSGIESEIRRLEKERDAIGNPAALRASTQTLDQKLAEARHLLARARSVQASLGRLDRSKVVAALGQLERLI